MLTTSSYTGCARVSQAFCFSVVLSVWFATVTAAAAAFGCSGHSSLVGSITTGLRSSWHLSWAVNSSISSCSSCVLLLREGTGPETVSSLISQSTASQCSLDRRYRGRTGWRSDFPHQRWRCCLLMRCCRANTGIDHQSDWFGCKWRWRLHWHCRSAQWCCLSVSGPPWMKSGWDFLQQKPENPQKYEDPANPTAGRVFHRQF